MGRLFSEREIMSLIHIICKRKGGRSFDIISGRRMRSIHLTTHCDALRRITTQQRKSQNLMCFNTLECSHEKPIRMSDMTFCFFCNNNINNRINNNINDINNIKNFNNSFNKCKKSPIILVQ